MQPACLAGPSTLLGHIPFISWLIEALRPSLLVDLGTNFGSSYNIYCEIIAGQRASTRVYAVSAHQANSDSGQRNNSPLKASPLQDNTRYESFLTLLGSTFDQALGQFDDGSIDLLHIDGRPTYEAVRHRFESWLPKISERGVVLFHDIEVLRDDSGAFRLWGELIQQYRGFAFHHSSGLGILLVGSHIPIPIRDLAAKMVDARSSIAREFFEALGLRFKQQVAIDHYNENLQVHSNEIERLRSLVADRDQETEEIRRAARKMCDAQLDSIAQLSERLSARDAELYGLTLARDAHAAQLTAMRRSWSWIATAPIRLVALVARGRLSEARRRLSRGANRLPTLARRAMARMRARALRSLSAKADAATNLAATGLLVDERNLLTREPVTIGAMSAQPPVAWPCIDLSVVTYNSERWIDSFIDSLEAIDYPKDCIKLRFVDNQSTDGTVRQLLEVLPRLRRLGMAAELVEQSNRGFGAGHNVGLAGGTGVFCLVANIDLEFAPDALSRIVKAALADVTRAVAWEFRQKPYEHPKFYDPVTNTTNWNSHACVLLRRSAFDAIGGYDENLFMYGEDVELSYRLRRQGGLLRYVPAAVVTHHSYESAGQIKPLQYTGSTFANLYLRLKFGSWKNARAVPGMALELLVAPQPFPGARRAVFRSLLRLIGKTPAALRQRKGATPAFAFRGWDYELTRDGAFVESKPLPTDCPLVSVITRTYRGRDQFLRQAILSVAHQTYPNIEHVVIEDGQETLRLVTDQKAHFTGLTIRYSAIEKAGRSAAGNAGLAAARGRWCLFLDDDDLLFADHVETLVQSLLEATDAVAAYSPALEVSTQYPDRPGESYRELAHTTLPTLHQPFDVGILRHHNFLAIQSVLFERRLFLERGGFELDLDAYEDWVLWNLYASRNTFVYVPKATSLFRTPADADARARRIATFEAAHQMAVERIATRLLEVNRRALRAAFQNDIGLLI